MKTLKKKNLKIDDPEEEEIRNKQKGNNNNNQSKYDRLFNLADSQSIEFDMDSVIFKKENIAIASIGMKRLTTDKFVSIIDHNDLEIGDYVGKGASGYVHKAVYKPNGMVVAVKSINIYDKDKRSQMKNDLKVLQDNNCSFLVKFFGAFFFEGNVKIVLEYMDLGSLDKVIEKIKHNKKPCAPEAILSKITQEILQGLLYLHKVKHQIHRDMKPGNILINSYGLVKLTDFGIAKTLENSSAYCNTFVGTKTYMSPERIMGKEYSYSSDIWSLGLILFELASGVFPYNFSKVFIEHVESILRDPEPTLPDDGTFSPEMQNFITRCLKKNPDERDTVAELCAHPWIIKYSDEEANLALWLAELYDNMIVD